MDWYPKYFDAYAEDTRHLTTLEHGAYNLLIDEYYRTRKPLPNNDVALANIVKLPVPEWLAISSTIRAFFRAKNGWLHQKKANTELDVQDKRAKKRSEKAQKAALVRHGKIKGIRATSKGQARAKHAQGLLGDATGTGTGTKDISNTVSPDRPISQHNGASNGSSNGHVHRTKNGKSIEVNPLRASRALPGNGKVYTAAEKHAAFEQRTLHFALTHYSRDEYARMVALQLSDDPDDQKKRKAVFNAADADYHARKAAGTLQPMD